MYNNQINKLDQIIDKTLLSITDSHDEIKEICSFAKNEYFDLEEEYAKLKIEASCIIKRVEELEGYLKISKEKLLFVNKNFQQFTDLEMKEIYEKTDVIRMELAIENERGINMIRRRNELELHLKSSKRIYEKADKLSNDFSVAYSVLAGDFKQITQQIDGMQNKEIWGVKVLEAQELERKRIARDMHDGPTQHLSNLILKTELCIKLIDKDTDRTKMELHSLKKLIRETIGETRRLIHNLRPMSIDDLGLIPTLERLVDEARNESNYEITFKHSLLENVELDPIVTLTIYRICQEALNNVKKYAHASKVIIELELDLNQLKLIIIDDGTGFEVDHVKLNHDDNRGFGISMMKERTNLLLGEFNIISTLQKGTTINVKLPIKLKKEV